MSDQHYIDQILANLKVISMIKTCTRLRIIKGQISLDFPSPVQPVRRWFYGDSRNAMIIHVRGVIHNALNVVKLETMLPSDDEDRIWIYRKILEALKNSRQGIQNLMKTYEADAVIVCYLEVLNDKINNCINKDVHSQSS